MAKLSISQAWEETRAVLAQDGKLILTVALAMIVLPGIVLDVTMPDTPAGQMPEGGAWVAVAVVAGLLSLVGQLAIIRLAMRPHISVGEAIVHGGRRLLPYLAAALIWVLPFIVAASLLFAAVPEGATKPPPAVSLALIIVIVIGLYLAVRFILMSAVASAEPSAPLAILRRAWAITSGNWWRLFGFMILFGIGALVLIWAVSSVVGVFAQLALGEVGRKTIAGLVVIMISQLVSALLFMTFFVMLARLYVQKGGYEAEAGVPNSGT
jgi:hypothetical protein